MADIYNPILAKEDIRQRSPFEKRLVPEANTALVFYREGQTPLVIEPGDPAPLRGQLMFGKYNWLYKVSKGIFSWNFQCDLPSKTNTFSFKAEVQLICSVLNPVMIVQDDITDVRQVVQPLIVDAMKNVSRKYEIEDFNVAEEQISNFLNNLYEIKEYVDTKYSDQENVDDKKKRLKGFHLNRFVLDLSSDRKIINIAQEKELFKRSSDFERTKITEKSNVERTSIQQDTELDRLRMEQDKVQLDRLKFKMDFYNTALQSGSLMMLAMQLAKNPDDVLVVAQLINQQNQFAANNQLNLLKVMLEEDAIEGAQLGEAGKRVVQRLIGLTESSKPALQSASTGSSKTSKTVSVENESNDASLEEVPDEFSR